MGNKNDGMKSVVDRIIAEKGREKKALIPILQAIQKELNYFRRRLRQVSEQTEITPDIYSVASFYAHSGCSRGKHMIKICGNRLL